MSRSSRCVNLCTGLPLLAALLWIPMTEAGPLRDALVDRMLSRQLERAQEAGVDALQGQMQTVPLPAGARLEKDVAYGDDPAQKMDVYIPRHDGLAPVIFMVHGGAWMIGDKGMSKVVLNKVERWLPQGYIVISINYPMLPNAPVSEQVKSVARALAAAQRQAADWGADPQRFVLMGHSAGAHLISLIAADPAIALDLGARPWRASVALDSAAMDVEQIMRNKHYRFYDDVFGADPAYWRANSPYQRLTQAPAAPMLMVCSSKRADACPQAQAFAKKVQSLGGNAQVLPQDLSHGDINGTLGEPGAYTEAVERFLHEAGA